MFFPVHIAWIHTLGSYITHSLHTASRLTSQCHSCLETLPQSARRAVFPPQFINRAVILACAQVFLFACIKTGFRFEEFGKKLTLESSSFKVTTGLSVFDKCRTLWNLTFCSSLEENLTAATGEGTVVAAGGLVGTDQACPLWREEELHGVRVVSARLKSAARHNGWDGRAETKPHAREGKLVIELLTLHLLIFISNLYFHKSKIEISCKVDMFVLFWFFFNFFVLPVRLIACLRHKTSHHELLHYRPSL